MKRETNTTLAIFNMVLVSLLTALVIISAKIVIPLGPVPVTMQTLVIVLSGILVGANQGALVGAVYLCIGLLGFPVFSKGGGIGYVVLPTFGFLLGFIPGAWLAGLISRLSWIHNEWVKSALAASAGIILIYLVGFAYIPVATQFLGANAAVWALILPTLPLMLVGDVVKIVIITSIAPVLQRELAYIRSGLGA